MSAAPLLALAATAASAPSLGWSHQLVLWTVDLGIVVVSAGMALCVLRLVVGPHLADRAMAADTLANMLVALVVLLMIEFQTLLLLDGVLVLTLLGFAGTVAMAQYIARPHLRKLRETAR